HANVACATCHVGHGVDNYVEAKFSGLRQVYQMAGQSFHRPIHAPNEKILAANETCTHCHRDESFLGVKLDTRFRYSYDIFNSKRYLQIIVNTGAGNGSDGPRLGIHWHTHSGNKVLFKAGEDVNEKIPWVKVEYENGSSIIYMDKESELTGAELDALPEQTMDCLDCHNRPAHQFLPPDIALDRALEEGAIDSRLPYIKKVATEAIAQEYVTKEEAHKGIRDTVIGYYTDNYEGQVLKREEALNASIEEMQNIYERNIFPDMEIGWNTYADNIGHRTSPGCFRCHGGDHVSDDGVPLRSDCSMCHSFYEKERNSESLIKIADDASSLHPFVHEEHSTVACWTCHSGATTPYNECASCHEDLIQPKAAMQFECAMCHTPGQTTVTNSSCTPCHPTLESPLHQHPDHGDCISCHTPHHWKSEDRPSCLPCHEMLGEETWEQHHPGESCSPCHDFTNVLSHMKGLPVSQ
ncbi:MAG: cytochrome c3 family protein, partial [Planctomycetota bacterium]